MKTLDRKRFPKALEVFARIQDPSAPIDTAMKRDAIVGIMQSLLPDFERPAFGNEVAKLDATLMGSMQLLLG